MWSSVLTLHCNKVYGVVIAEWVHTGLITSGVLTIHCYNFGNPQSPIEMHNSWFAVPIMCSAVSVITQCFFAWRIYMFSKSRWLAGGVVAVRSLTPCFIESPLTDSHRSSLSFKVHSGLLLESWCVGSPYLPNVLLSPYIG